MRTWIPRLPNAIFPHQRNVRVVDATRVKEPGPTGSSWCVYYAIDLPSLRCAQLVVLDSSGSGETFKRYRVNPGDLLIGDRGYGSPPGIAHVLGAGGDVLVRFGWTHLPLWTASAEPFDLLGRLRTLKGTRIGDWEVTVRHQGHAWPGRVCALRKSRQATEQARQKLKRAAQKHGGTRTRPETLETAEYVVVFTSLSRDELPPTAALELYRGRWQVELVFKRLKSIMGFGHLRKKDPEGARAWLQGKLLVAFLVEALIAQGEALFPWGYPLDQAQSSPSNAVA